MKNPHNCAVWQVTQVLVELFLHNNKMLLYRLFVSLFQANNLFVTVNDVIRVVAEGAEEGR